MEQDKLKMEVANILAKHGIRMCVWGCGCCDSPMVAFEYKGKSIIGMGQFLPADEGLSFTFNMFNEGEDHNESR